MSEIRKAAPRPCAIDARGFVFDGPTVHAQHGEIAAVAIPLDLAAWPDDVRERVVEAMARERYETTRLTESWDNAESYARAIYRESSRTVLETILAALAQEVGRE